MAPAWQYVFAEMLIMGLQRGDLDWREMLHTKSKY